MLVIADADKKKLKNAARKTIIERRKISLLKDVMIRKLLKEKATKLVDIGATHWWRHFDDGVLKACEEECGKKMWRISKGVTWCRNKEVKEAVSSKKDAHKVMCQNSMRVRGIKA